MRMAHGQTAPTTVQSSLTRLTPGRAAPRVPHIARPRQSEDGARRAGPPPAASAAATATATFLGEIPLWPGMTGSAQGTPARRPGSIRRTTSVMMERPQGLTGPLHLISTGRDLLTTTAGEAVVVGEARLRVVLDYMAAPGGVLEIESEPPVPALADLVGASTRSGFRTAARRALTAPAGDLGGGAATPATDRSLLGQLLDDVPVAVLVSGAALGRNGIFREGASVNAGAEAGGNPMIDVCAGWQQGGLLAQLSAERRANPGTPVRAVSVPAGDLALGDDPLGWHPLPPMPPNAMRRLRRIDVVPVSPGPAGGGPTDGEAPRGEATDGAAAGAVSAVEVEALFRDSYLEAPGREVLVHEYGVEAEVDSAGLISRARARAGALPGRECPQALGSADRLVGLPAAELRRTVGRAFVGTSTCTHLNDTFRTLGDLPDLITFLGGTAER
ncbi:DUF2889 domain-containing protein [Parafrankia colletiae]|nr:DUF2889 domain-containing protein [Parafrankia colletiae]